MELAVREALRYLGAGEGADEALTQTVAAVGRELAGRLTPRHVLRLYPVERTEKGFRLTGSGVVLTGSLAGRMLSDCHSAALLGCTLGAQFDALLRQTQARDMARAAILDAWGSVMVEAGCDGAQQELQALVPGQYLTDRFSPGYGDLPLELQRELGKALDLPRRLGVCVTESLMLNPAKSVTAVVGISHLPQPARVRGCAHCAMGERCTLRRGGGHCER